MPYFDGRESEPTDTELKRVRDQFNSETDDVQMITAHDVTVKDYGGGQFDIEYTPTPKFKVGTPTRCLYPRPPTEDLAREMYFNDELTESEFEQMIGQVLEIEGIDWGL